MKKQLLVISMSAIVLATVFVAGCTGGVTNTASPSPVASTIPSANEFTDRWARDNSNDTVVTPFTKSVNERGHVTFTGLTRGPYSHGDKTRIFELCKDKADAQRTYQQEVDQASLSGYIIDSRDENNTIGHIQSNEALTNTIIIGWNSPDDYGIGYYVEAIKMLAPTT